MKIYEIELSKTKKGFETGVKTLLTPNKKDALKEYYYTIINNLDDIMDTSNYPPTHVAKDATVVYLNVYNVEQNRFENWIEQNIADDEQWQYSDPSDLDSKQLAQLVDDLFEDGSCTYTMSSLEDELWKI